jgi:hypothetical protein
MSGGQDCRDELRELMAAMNEGELSPAQEARIEQLVVADVAARRFYIESMFLFGKLQRIYAKAADEPSTVDELDTFPSASSSIPPIILDDILGPQPSLVARYAPIGGVLFSYLVAVPIVALGLLIGWMCKAPRLVELADGANRPATAAAQPDIVCVGRITGMVDCQWTDPKAEVYQFAAVPLGWKYELAAGFLEITYVTGAKVILEGPCTYEVDSADSGYLARGKLTACVRNKRSVPGGQGSEGERTVNPTVSERHPQVARDTQPTASLALRPSGEVEGRESSVESHALPPPLNSRLSTINSGLFSVRTPTAIVTDLGTEFGVEVDASGSTKSQVFQGRIELRVVNTSGSEGVQGQGALQVVRLGRNESAAVQAAPGMPAALISPASRAKMPAFVRQLPRWSPIQVFSTGIGLRHGETDPHWQITAFTGDPKFVPRSAVVTRALPLYLPNNPEQSQWISLDGEPVNMPDGVYTFRTTFRLGEVSPEPVILQGRFLADNQVRAIRLNGHAVPVPEYGMEPPFDKFHAFVVRSGFVVGTNVLEVDVRNLHSSRGEHTPMALRLELKGFVRRTPQIEPAAETDTKESPPIRQ